MTRWQAGVRRLACHIRGALGVDREEMNMTRRPKQKARWSSVLKVLLPKWGGSRSYRQLKEGVDWFRKSDVWPTKGDDTENSPAV
jgi:hypothetical protein